MALARRDDDDTFYPETDDMGEGELQRLISELLRPLLARFLAERGVVAHVGADQFHYYRKGDATRRVAPDIYVLPNVPQERISPRWKVWEVGPPSFCIEIVSRDHGKDYEDSPAILGAIGVRELVIFDPEAAGRRGRYRFQVYRRTREGFMLAARTNATASARARSRPICGSSDTAMPNGFESRRAPAANRSSRPTPSAPRASVRSATHSRLASPSSKGSSPGVGKAERAGSGTADALPMRP